MQAGLCMASSIRPTAASDIRRFLQTHELRAYCDECLALRFEVSLEDVQVVALFLADGPGFVRQRRKCGACSRIVETTSVGVRLRRLS